MRIPPAFPEAFAQPPVVGRTRDGFVRQMRSYELITPLFGGGMHKGVPDPELPVTGKTVRGQLRFWWRALRGGAFGNDLHALKEAEDALWGRAAQDGDDHSASRVEVSVVISNAGTACSPFKVIGRPGRDGQLRPVPQAVESVAPAYVAFPLQPTTDEARRGGIDMKTKTVQVGVTFCLEVVCPTENLKELLQTLWLWETFGGVGGRTRRGFGALRLVAIDGEPNKVTPWIASDPQSVVNFLNRFWKSAKLSAGQWPDGVPHLRNWGLAHIPSAGGKEILSGDAFAVWSQLVKRYRDFRQRRDPPGHQPRRPGRSHWPEPDSCRLITDSGHHPIRNSSEKFPRGVLGLPIIFEFPDGEVPKTTLTLPAHERLASPLIIKPLSCAQGAVGLIASLHPIFPPVAPDEEHGFALPMKLVGETRDWDGEQLVESAVSLPDDGPIAPLNGTPDVLDACMRAIIG